MINIMKYTLALATVTLLVTSTYAQWTPSPLCPYPSDNLTRFQYEGDCTKYWECYQGARYPMDCPSGLEYNAAASRCDAPEIANCDPDATIIYPTFSHSTVTTPSQEPTPDPGPKPECPFPSDELVFFPVANNCSQYWECFQGNRYLMNCPTGQYWNQQASYCDYPANVDCKADNSTTSPGTTATPGNDTSVTTPGTGTPSPITSTTVNPDDQACIGKPDGTYLPDPYDCHKFWECVGQKVIEGQCAGDLVWNETALTCDRPENVNCSTSKTLH